MCQLQLQETQGLTDAFDLAAIAGAAAIVGDCVPDGNWVSFGVFHLNALIFWKSYVFNRLILDKFHIGCR